VTNSRTEVPYRFVYVLKAPDLIGLITQPRYFL